MDGTYRVQTWPPYTVIAPNGHIVQSRVEVRDGFTHVIFQPLLPSVNADDK